MAIATKAVLTVVATIWACHIPTAAFAQAPLAYGTTAQPQPSPSAPQCPVQQKAKDPATAAKLKEAEDAMGDDNGKAYLLLLGLANQGIAEAEDMLGQVLSGTWGGSSTDYPAAMNLFRRAADHGDMMGALNLASMYEDGGVMSAGRLTGRAIPVDYAAAITWNRTALDCGDALTQTLARLGLARTYEKEQDYVQAYNFYDIVAGHRSSLDLSDGDEPLTRVAAISRDQIAAKMTQNQIDEAKRLARAEIEAASARPGSPQTETVARTGAGGVRVAPGAQEPLRNSLPNANELTARASSFVAELVRLWSEPNGQSLSKLNRLYANQVTYYGKPTTREGVLDDKARFAVRWPDRKYQIRAGSLDANCENVSSTCEISGIVDWQAQNAARRALSSGSARFSYTLAAAGSSFIVIAETSSILHRGSSSQPQQLAPMLTEQSTSSNSTVRRPSPAIASSSDNQLVAALADCDAQAQQQITVAKAKKTVAPIDLLAWPLLLNDLATRRRQELDQPHVLAAIEQQRQQCRQAAEAAALQRVQETRDEEHDRERGYQRISVRAFVLDGTELAAKAEKISLTGAYMREGNVDVLYADTRAVIIANNYPNLGEQPKVLLLMDGASRQIRERFLMCQSNPASAQVGCGVTILGQVTTCTVTNAFGASRQAPCIAVTDGR